MRERVKGDALPDVNTLVRVTIGSSPDPEDPPVARDVPSRVEDVAAGRPGTKRPMPTIIYIAVPSYSGDIHVPVEGTACDLAWLTPIGVFELPTAFHGREKVGPVVRAWRLAVTGGAVRAQRRRFVRAAWSGPVRIEGVTGDETVELALAGQGIDLSEGGVRCLLPPPQLLIGHDVRVVLTHPQQEMALPARVVRAEPTTTPAGRMIVTSLAFNDPDAYGDALRRLVFTQQLRARRAGLA